MTRRHLRELVCENKLPRKRALKSNELEQRIAIHSGMKVCLYEVGAAKKNEIQEGRRIQRKREGGVDKRKPKL